MQNSMTFNGIRNPNIHLLEGRRKSPFAPVIRNIVSRKSGHRLKSTERGLLDIAQPIGFIVKNDMDALAMKDALSSWLVTDDAVPLQFDDEPGRTYHAVVQNSIDDFDRFVKQRKGTIQFVSLYETGASRDLALTSTYQTFTIGGQSETPWKSRTRFSIPQSQYVLENNQGGKIILNYSFITGDVLEIDYFKRKITLNGKNLAVALSLASHWFDLKPRFAYLRASHPTTLTYDERY